MVSEFLPAAVIWAALGTGVACLVLRLIWVHPDEPAPSDTPAAEAPPAGE